MDKALILNAIKENLNFRYDKELAEFLGIKTTTLAMWYKRNTYDTELIFNKCEYLSPEWLLTGKGPMLRTQSIPVVSEIDKTHKELADARLDVIDGLKFKIAALEQTISELKYANKEPTIYANVAEPAPKLEKEKRK